MRKRYHIIIGRSPTQLAERVNTVLQAGWDLQGGVAFVPSSSLTGRTLDDPPKDSDEITLGLFCQAVVHEE